MKFDYSKLQNAMREFARDSGRSKHEVCRMAARGFVKDVVSITPPASKGVAGMAAKKAGEAAIVRDLQRIFLVMGDAQINQFTNATGGTQVEDFGHRGAKSIGQVTTKVLSRGEMAVWHGSRRGSDGRVKGGGKGGMLNRIRASALTTGLKKSDLPALDVGIVRKADFDWFAKTLQKMVGFLSAGWNAAAQKLGVKLPAWVKRHGTSFGEHKVTETATTLRIELSNTVGFVGNVKAYEGRVQKAINYQARKMGRQVDALLRKRLRKAGFR